MGYNRCCDPCGIITQRGADSEKYAHSSDNEKLIAVLILG